MLKDHYQRTGSRDVEAGSRVYQRVPGRKQKSVGVSGPATAPSFTKSCRSIVPSTAPSWSCSCLGMIVPCHPADFFE